MSELPRLGSRQEDLPRMGLLEHLDELRRRLVRAVIAFMATFLACYAFSEEIYAFLAQPIYRFLPPAADGTPTKLVFLGVTDPFILYIKVAALAGIFLGSPIILYQVWAFVAPGLYKKEKHFAFPLLASSIMLFYAGVAFAYYVVFPLVFGFFTAVTPDGVEMMTDISAYLDFITTIVLAFGIAFEVPIATVLVVWTGLTTPDKLGKARPYVFLGAFVVGMLLTPPDIISQTLLAVPVYLLYEAGIIMSRVFSKKPEEEERVSVK